MLHRFVDTIRHGTHGRGFCAYYQSLQGSRVSGLPTLNEARRDFREINHARAYHGF